MRSHKLKTNQSDRPLIRRAPKEFPNNHLKVCGISHADVYSQSFNGLGIASRLLKEGIEYSLLSDIHLRGFGKSLTPKKLQGTKKLIVKLERISGYQSRLFFWTRFLKFKREFKNADLIHYHILHNEYFRLEALKYLTRKKQVFGHCTIYGYLRDIASNHSNAKDLAMDVVRVQICLGHWQFGGTEQKVSCCAKESS